MRFSLLIAFQLCSGVLLGQNGYSAIIDLFDNSSDIFFSLLEIDDEVYTSIGNRCANFTTDCSAIGKINVDQGTLDWSKRIEWLDPGTRSIDQRNGLIEMSGHDYWEQSKFYLHRRSLNGDSLATFELIPPNGLYDLHIAGNFTFGNHSIVYGNSRQKNTDNIPAILFWVNDNGDVDSTLLIESGTEVNQIYDMHVGPDGLLTVLVDFEEIVGGDFPYQIRRKQLLKFNEDMELVWQWQTDNEINFSSLTPSRLTILSDGTIVIVAQDNSPFDSEIWGISEYGIQWKYKFPVTGNTEFATYSLIEASNGDILGCGQTRDGNEYAGQHGMLFRMTSAGEMLWTKAIIDSNNSAPSPVNGNNIFFDLIELNDGSILAGGMQNVWYYNNDNQVINGLDAWLVRTESDGCIIEDCEYVQDLTSVSVIPESESIIVFPNPASDLFTVSWTEELSISQLQIYNSMGQLIRSQKPNKHSILLNASLWTPGIYFITLQDKAGRIHTEKVFITTQ